MLKGAGEREPIVCVVGSDENKMGANILWPKEFSTKTRLPQFKANVKPIGPAAGSVSSRIGRK